MFVVAVLAFAVGIYLQTFYPLPLLCLTLFLVTLFLVPLVIKMTWRGGAMLLLCCFCAAGMMRIEISRLHSQPLAINDSRDVYEGVVTEASPKTKIIRLITPHRLKGMKVAYRNQDNLTINDAIKVFGELREMHLTFNNPGIRSWKWLKRLEAVSYEIRGSLIGTKAGTNMVEEWRNFLKQRIETSGAPYGSIIKALTIGDTTALDEHTRDLFLHTGTSHILAVSGSNIAIITGFFFFIARFLTGRLSMPMRLSGNDRRYASLLSIPFAVAFMVTAGASIPTIRATIMIVIFMLSLYFERGRHLIHTLALSALVILLIYPHSLYMPTFQLTFMSVLFLILFTGKLLPFLHGLHRSAQWLLSSVIMTVAATLGTAPIVLHHFFGINPLSFIHNLIAVPLMCVVAMPLSLVGLITPSGDYLLRFSGEVLSFTMWILRHLNFGYIYPLPRPGLFEVILFLVALLGIINVQKRLVLVSLLLVVLPISVIQGYCEFDKRFGDHMTISFLDVGMGDSILIEGPKGTRILIDGGGFYRGDYDIGKSVITPILLSKKILTLDYVVNTHPHGDHIGGLSYIVRHFNVKAFATSGYFVKEGKFVDILHTVREKKVPFQLWQKGESRSFPGDMEVKVLNPEKEVYQENLNNASLVLRISHGNTAFLLAGDIDREIEERMILDNSPLRAQVLKIPHHGSKNSNSPSFLKAVNPDLAVLSVGPGIKGLPSEAALSTYRRMEIPLLRTDRNGCIEVASDGERITYRTYLENSVDRYPR